MEKANDTNGFKPCPRCCSEVDIVVVQHSEMPSPRRYFFVNCECCGEGTANAYQSVRKLQCIWNHQADLALLDG